MRARERQNLSPLRRRPPSVDVGELAAAASPAPQLEMPGAGAASAGPHTSGDATAAAGLAQAMTVLVAAMQKSQDTLWQQNNYLLSSMVSASS